MGLFEQPCGYATGSSQLEMNHEEGLGTRGKQIEIQHLFSKCLTDAAQCGIICEVNKEVIKTIGTQLINFNIENSQFQCMST